MDFLEKLNQLMLEKGLNKSTLSRECGIPYTTIDGWYKKGYQELRLSTLKRLATFFNTSLDYWANDNEFNLTLSDHEKKLILMYRRKRELQPAVDKLLDISESDSIAADAADTVENLDAEFKKVSVEKR